MTILYYIIFSIIILLVMGYFFLSIKKDSIDKKINLHKRNILLKRIPDHEFNHFVERVYESMIKDMPKFECTHKSHRDKRTPEECILKQEFYYKSSIEKKAKKFAKVRYFNWKNAQTDLVTHLDNVMNYVYKSFVLRVNKSDEFTSKKWKQLDGQEYKYEDLPELPEFGNSFHYEAQIDQ
jgi:uncharacterized membrane protein YraQ (UPF0718 family)